VKNNKIFSISIIIPLTRNLIIYLSILKMIPYMYPKIGTEK